MCVYTHVHIQASIPCHAVSHATSELVNDKVQHLILKCLELRTKQISSQIYSIFDYINCSKAYNSTAHYSKVNRPIFQPSNQCLTKWAFSINAGCINKQVIKEVTANINNFTFNIHRKQKVI